jgi:ABC-type Na+ efflux pump permease subunit
MKQVMIVFKKEWMSFVGSDRGLFAVYLVLIASWGMLLATWKESVPIVTPLWLAMFSVIVTATFSNTVFVAERVSGQLELFLTSGISRRGILYGKMAFVFCMTMLVGAACIGCAVFLRPLMMPYGPRTFAFFNASGFALYAAATFLNAASTAYLSVVMSNPRMLHFINLLLVGFIVSVRIALESFFPVPFFAMPVALALLGIVFTILAEREFNGERIIKPVVL